MVPYSNWLLLVGLVAAIMVGAATGAIIAGLAFTILGRTRKPKVSWDIALGAIGFVAGVFICIYMPFPRNTVHENLGSGVTVATTMNEYQHPYWVAFTLAALLPVAFEIWRSKRRISK